jgi:hypothetical protein
MRTRRRILVSDLRHFVVSLRNGRGYDDLGILPSSCWSSHPIKPERDALGSFIEVGIRRKRPGREFQRACGEAWVHSDSMPSS